ncbi:MAG: hypothetical protein IKG82_14735 [Oscillospiraceae bacterium]|nr:hypothetical protein [Oscillospiraceae bacterium]
MDPTDNDQDGLPDILEAVGIRCSTGKIITSDPTKRDTDGDGLKDGDEILKDSLRIRSYNFPAATYQLSNAPVFFKMKSDPNKQDTDGDGITDPNEYRNVTTDSRYDSVSPQIKNTLESFYPELSLNDRTKTRVLLSQPVTVDLEKNTINITINYSVNDFALTASAIFDKSTRTYYTHEEIIVKSILNKWNNQHFTGNKYDFYPGLEFQTNVQMINVSDAYGPRARAIPFTVSEDDNNSTGTNNWAVNSIRTVSIGTKNSSGGYADELNRFAAPAHELGHVLGISDVYGYSGAGDAQRRFQATVYDINQTTDNEIWYETLNISGNKNPTGDIM